MHNDIHKNCLYTSHKENIGNFLLVEIQQTILPYHKGIKLDIIKKWLLEKKIINNYLVKGKMQNKSREFLKI